MVHARGPVHGVEAQSTERGVSTRVALRAKCDCFSSEAPGAPSSSTVRGSTPCANSEPRPVVACAQGHVRGGVCGRTWAQRDSAQ